MPLVDQTYFVRTGKWSYRLASEHELAEETEQRVLLEKLAAYFELYMDALSEMSDRYILGFDFNLIADKMLDSINSYRRTGEERYLENARRYAAILKLDPEAFPSVMKRAAAARPAPSRYSAVLRREVPWRPCTHSKRRVQLD